MSDIEHRNKLLCEAYAAGEPMTSISRRTGISCTQLSRIFRKANVKRQKYELDRDYFERNKHKSKRQISEETGIPLKRVKHLYRVAYGKPLSRGKLDFADQEPLVDPNLFYDDAWITKQYVELGRGTPSIAKDLGRKSSEIVRRLKSLGIKLRSPGQAVKKKRPSKEWLVENYVNKKYSIAKCADMFGVSFDTIYSSLSEYSIPLRSASDQQMGELNSFYGKQHDPKVAEFCRKVGAKYGKEYWTIGDVDAKIEDARARAIEVWDDPDKRSEHSKRMTELCSIGGCNSRKVLYVRNRDGKSFLFRSSWEYAIALFLESCELVVDWDFETLSVPFKHDGVFRNFLIDFEVKWVSGLTTYIECKNKHLLSKPIEQQKIKAGTDFLRANSSNLIVIDDISGIDSWNDNFIPKDYVELSGKRYSVKKTYLSNPPILLEMFRHYLTKKLVGWEPLRYSDVELSEDLEKMKRENIDNYSKNGLRSTVPNFSGMPGRPTLLHFQPHFLEVPINNTIPLSESFSDPWVIYRSILRSMEEEESLTLERLLREINFHFTKYSRVSHFAPGFARAIIRLMDSSEKIIFDPCCGWGGRLIGSFLEGCEYFGTELSVPTFNGLRSIAEHLGCDFNVQNASCLDVEWPECDLIFTSPPFYNIEKYIGDDQPWKIFESRNEWVDGFVKPFAEKCLENGAKIALYVDALTRDDFLRFIDLEVIPVSNRRHARHKSGNEYLCIYRG